MKCPGGVISLLPLDTVPASLLMPPEDTRVEVGGNVPLMCTARGYPLPQVTWLRGGMPLTRGININITSSDISPTSVMSVLDLYDLQISDTGVYQCMAENTLISQSELFNNSAVEGVNLAVLGKRLE